MRFCEPTEAQEKGFRKWVRSRPKKVRAVAERFDIWTLYRLKDTGDRVTLHAFANDGTVTVIVSGRFNLVMFEREVFGINPNDLEECDLPTADEPVGAALSPKEAADSLDELRVLVRPDLWTMEDGKAVRKQ